MPIVSTITERTKNCEYHSAIRVYLDIVMVYQLTWSCHMAEWNMGANYNPRNIHQADIGFIGTMSIVTTQKDALGFEWARGAEGITMMKYIQKRYVMRMW
jgi:hypothetical protein